MIVRPERMSLAEFLEHPEVKPARELRHGMVSQRSSATGGGSAIQAWVGSRIEAFDEATASGRAFPAYSALQVRLDRCVQAPIST